LKKVSNNLLLKKRPAVKLGSLIIIVSIFLSSSFLIPNSNNIKKIDRDFNDLSQTPLLADIDSVLFEGNEISLNITDYGNLYETNQEVSLTNQEELNLTYYLDDVNSWKISTIDNNISNLRDTRDWVNNSDFIPANIYRVYETVESEHDPYGEYWWGSPAETIYLEGALAMRVHFVNMSFTEDADYLFIEDESNSREYCTTGVKEDFFSPWIYGEELNLIYESDDANPGNEYGYYVDYYEFINDSSYVSNSDSWGFNSVSTYGASYGPGTADNASGMYLKFDGSQTWDSVDEEYDSRYYKDDFAELYQNITVPRGKVIDSYISFSYNAESCLPSSNNFIYAAINGQKVFSIGFIDVVDNKGRNKWHSTGQLNSLLWVNSSNLFENPISNQNINISLGIKSGSSTRYGGYEDRFHQIVWFDNITLGLTTISNSSQDGINLSFNTISLSNGNKWGCSEIKLNNTWESNPVILTVNTTSPSLTFNLNTTLYGFHNTTSKINQQNDDGIKYRILENGTIYWEFYHNLYTPSPYEDFHFKINKPENWEFISVLDPYLQLREFEGGSTSDKYLIVNSTNAIYHGWWTFIATSPNFLQEENLETSKNNQWGISEFQTGNIGQIKAQINYSSEIPINLDQTFANLTIYNPEGAVWFEDSAVPLANGTVLFSTFNIAAQNSTGGIHNFTIFWGNGTSIGGLESNFIITHDSYITLLRPDDAKLDNSTGGSVGDILPLRIYLRDSENDNPISNAILSFNWTSGPVSMVEIGLGLYDAIIDTSDLGALGLYTIVVLSYKIGFGNSTFNLEINLGEDTVLQRLGSDSSIVINQNSTITFYYYSEVDDESITGATIIVNITNPMYYSVTETTPGTYSILINTVFLDSTGIYHLIFDFSAPGYEPQTHIYQFNIVNPPPPSGSNPYLELIIIISIAVIIFLGALSIRSYVILPRKRRREADLLSRTQRFKDIQNIQAIVAIHRDSGIPLYTKSYSILEKHKKEIFSGFIQAILTVGEEMVERREEDGDLVKSNKEDGSRTILELDFKYFFCLICDRQDLRIIFVLTERASDRLKNVISDLSLGAMLELSEQIGNWDGAIHEFEARFPKIINKYVELYFKEAFTINNAEIIAKMRKKNELNSIETRILNVIYSFAQGKKEFYLKTIFEIIHEKNENVVIDGIEGLIKKQVIIPSTK